MQWGSERRGLGPTGGGGANNNSAPNPRFGRRAAATFHGGLGGRPGVWVPAKLLTVLSAPRIEGSKRLFFST